MFIKLEELYIKIDSVDVLGVYETPTKTGREIGLLLNDERYTVYEVEGQPTSELLKELRDNMRNIILQIIQETEQEVKSIKIPRPDMSKFVETTKAETKEQIND